MIYVTCFRGATKTVKLEVGCNAAAVAASVEVRYAGIMTNGASERALIERSRRSSVKELSPPIWWGFWQRCFQENFYFMTGCFGAPEVLFFKVGVPLFACNIAYLSCYHSLKFLCNSNTTKWFCLFEVNAKTDSVFPTGVWIWKGAMPLPNFFFTWSGML